MKITLVMFKTEHLIENQYLHQNTSDCNQLTFLQVSTQICIMIIYTSPALTEPSFLFQAHPFRPIELWKKRDDGISMTNMQSNIIKNIQTLNMIMFIYNMIFSESCAMPFSEVT